MKDHAKAQLNNVSTNASGAFVNRRRMLISCPSSLTRVCEPVCKNDSSELKNL